MEEIVERVMESSREWSVEKVESGDKAGLLVSGPRRAHHIVEGVVLELLLVLEEARPPPATAAAADADAAARRAHPPGLGFVGNLPHTEGAR